MPDQTTTAIEKVNAERAKAEERLTISEQIAYDKALRSGRAPLAPEFNQKLYELYLRGFSCEDIAAQNPGLNLGSVARARVDGNWDERRDQYTSGLLTDSAASLRQTAAESLNFLSLVLAVAHKEHGERLRRYLVTGDPKDLGDFRINNFSSYKLIIETIARLVGADQKKTVNVNVNGGRGTSDAGSPADSGGIIGAVTGTLTPRQADAMRRALEATKE
jgi:hypothetical protein